MKTAVKSPQNVRTVAGVTMDPQASHFSATSRASHLISASSLGSAVSGRTERARNGTGRDGGGSRGGGRGSASGKHSASAAGGLSGGRARESCYSSSAGDMAARGGRYGAPVTNTAHCRRHRADPCRAAPDRTGPRAPGRADHSDLYVGRRGTGAVRAGPVFTSPAMMCLWQACRRTKARCTRSSRTDTINDAPVDCNYMQTADIRPAFGTCRHRRICG